MALSQIPERQSYPQSIANPVLAQVTLEALLAPARAAEENQLRVVRSERQEGPDHDPLGSAKGIVNGLRLSVTLWSFIALVVLLMR